MTQDNQHLPNPAKETQMMVESFLEAVRLGIKERQNLFEWDQLLEAIQQKKQQIQKKNQDLVVDEPSFYHLQTDAVVLATYQILLEKMSKEEAIVFVRQALIDPLKAYGEESMKWILDYTDRPFDEIVQASKLREKYFFGSTFSFVRKKDDAEAYLLEVNSCFHHRFFTANKAPELTAIFCEVDNIWIRHIDSQKYGISFRRPTTMGFGGKKCSFQFFHMKG